MSTVVRIEKNKNYTTIANYLFKDKELSLKAKGLLSLMLSLPEDWDYTIEGLTKLSKDGRDSVSSALKELEEHGYLSRCRLKDDKGRLGDSCYTIYEKSIFFNNEVKPVTENPATENPVQENHQQLNTKLLSTKELNTHISISNAESEFEELWKIYPKKSGKAIALKKYIQYRTKDNGLFNKVKYGITEYSKDYFKNHNSNDLQYMKDGSTFFNQKVWEDYEVYNDVLNTTKEIVIDQIADGAWEEFDYDNYGF